MLKNYFKTAWRNLIANKFYSVINITGLAVGLATGIMLLLWVQNEKSYDKFHKHYADIYRLSSHFDQDGKETTWDGVPGPLAVFAASLPEVKSVVRIQRESGLVLSDKDKRKIFVNNTVAFVDKGFFSMFDFHLLRGNGQSLFPNNNSIVITQSTAQKLYGHTDVIGKVVQFYGNSFTVTGVLADFPENSSLQYDVIVPMGFYAAQFTADGGNGDWKTIDTDLGDYNFYTYVQLKPDADYSKIGIAFTEAYKKARNGESNSRFQLQNLADVHLVGADGNNSALRMVQIFLLVAVLLLLIAGINYVNLSTARSLIRAKEVSIRKIVGASKRQLFFQFISETFLVFCIAALIAIVLIYLLMPLYNNISGKTLNFSLTDYQVWFIVVCSIVGTLAAASIYPALQLSGFDPIQSLKGKITAGMGTSLLRKTLVVFQFAVSVVMIICTLVIGNQMKYVRQKNLGYDKSYVFNVPLTEDAVKHGNTIKNELIQQQGILKVSLSNIRNLSQSGSSTGDIDWKGKPVGNHMIIAQACIDKDFIPAMKIRFVDGGNFYGTPADSTRYILNEAAVRQMGLKPPYSGQEITFHERKGTISGVVADFNFESLKEKVSPLLLFAPQWGQSADILYVRTTAVDAQKAIAAAESQYKKYAGDIPFSYNFLDKQFETLYKSDMQQGVLFNLFAAIAILISCLGLLGLATFTAQRRTKEIGVRKVLGASVGNIIQLISKDFLKLLLIAIVIAVPVAWMAMNKWLENYAYKINIGAWVFLLAGMLAIIIAFVTISFQAIKAAVANPVKSLRSE